MKRHSRFTLGALLLGSGLASAAFAQSATTQTPSTVPAPPQVTMTTPKTEGGYSATFTGCIERAAKAPSGTDESFMLTHAIRGTANNIPAAVGTSGKAAAGPQETTYKVDAAAATVAPHVGHEVELSGVVTVVMGGTAQATADSALAMLGGTPQVKVEKIRMLSATCSR